MISITSISRMHGEITMRAVSAGRDGRLATRPHTLLIIEDDATTRLALACMVADSTRQIVTADSAEDALERLPLIDPDLILCDFVLGGMNGREFCQAVRSRPQWRHVPVVMVTCIDAPSVLADLLRSGADDVVTKPVRPEELRTRVLVGLRGAVISPGRHATEGQRCSAC